MTNSFDTPPGFLPDQGQAREGLEWLQLGESTDVDWELYNVSTSIEGGHRGFDDREDDEHGRLREFRRHAYVPNPGQPTQSLQPIAWVEVMYMKDTTESNKESVRHARSGRDFYIKGRLAGRETKKINNGLETHSQQRFFPGEKRDGVTWSSWMTRVVKDETGLLASGHTTTCEFECRHMGDPEPSRTRVIFRDEHGRVNGLTGSPEQPSNDSILPFKEMPATYPGLTITRIEYAVGGEDYIIGESPDPHEVYGVFDGSDEEVLVCTFDHAMDEKVMIERYGPTDWGWDFARKVENFEDKCGRAKMNERPETD